MKQFLFLSALGYMMAPMTAGLFLDW